MADVSILLECAKTGNAEAFGDLYELYAKGLYLYAYKYLGNKEDAEDAVLEATLKVFKSINNIKSADKIKAYYFKAVANTARTMLSKRTIHIVDIDDNENLSDNDNIENNIIDRHSVDEVLKILDADEREIVLLSVVSGFSSKEIAKITDMTAGSVRSKLSRSLAKLRNAMADYER